MLMYDNGPITGGGGHAALPYYCSGGDLPLPAIDLYMNFKSSGLGLYYIRVKLFFGWNLRDGTKPPLVPVVTVGYELRRLLFL